MAPGAHQLVDDVDVVDEVHHERLHLQGQELDVGAVRGVLLQPRREARLQLRQRLVSVRVRVGLGGFWFGFEL